MDFLTPEKIISGLAAGLLTIVLFVIRKFDAKQRQHEDHLRKLDNGLYALELDVAKNRPDKSDLEKIHVRIGRLEDKLEGANKTLNRVEALMQRDYRGEHG